ncbi:glycosyltransferase [Aeromicrobium duanguangcaii]|uniref:Glycosyltransferase n=1 Tax=Aeromicrobium duanguangcaii TaxID=2968086 RepID=A0ABY5KDJ4_9ACTN|nr:glycosyltransferase [Aeromicrobium duanguangcaii]MCD9154717.1 glycosyltransferase [Aeromicrobium duanguangcaii]UUI67869.1 glycosyltransferase [Aeromicrobium duanguangcaii]
MHRLSHLRSAVSRRLRPSGASAASAGQVRDARAESRRWAQAYEQLLAAAQGRRPGKPPREVPEDAVAGVAKRRDPALTDWLLAGTEPSVAYARAAREIVLGQGAPRGQAFADALVARLGGAPGHLAAATVAYHRKLTALADHHFSQVTESEALTAAPLELVGTLFACDPKRAQATVERWLAEDLDLGTQTWFDALRHVWPTGDAELTARLHERVVATHEATGSPGWADAELHITWIDRWRGATRGRSLPTPTGRVPFAVIDYVQPGRTKTSQNIGDHIQTLASLGHVARHQNLRWHGEEGLPELLGDLQQRVRPELRLDTAAGDVELYRMERDASSFQAFPEGTWLLEFGWHMHDLLASGVWDFPLHPNLRPIFVSFHCNKRALLTEESLEYLRTYGPIGCRDWTTVDLLLSLDVPAFFSGCITTSVSTVFPELSERPEPATVYVDHVRGPVPKGQRNIKQSRAIVKRRSFIENMREAITLLEWYRTNFTDVVTMRLHCYLPTRSLGLAVDFQPKFNADIRFNGLYDIDDREFDAIRARMIERLQPVLAAILSGAGEDDVYALWRETVAGEVAAARARHDAVIALDAPGASAAELVAPLAVQDAPVGADAVDVVLVAAERDLARLPTFLTAAAAASSRPLRFHVLAPLADPGVSAPTGHEVRWVDTTSVPAAERKAVEVLVPELLGGVRRAVLLPMDAIVLGDLAELAGLDLGGHAVAARDTTLPGASGFQVFYDAARRLDDDPHGAYDFYRRVHARHVFDFDAYDTAVLVLDLERLRAEGFTDEMLTHVRAFGLTTREALHLYAGPHRAAVPPQWAHVPTREHLDEEPSLVHWADRAKPWSGTYVARQELWPTTAAAPVSPR